MAEEVRNRMLERETMPGSEYEKCVAQRQEFLQKGISGDIVIKESARDWDVSRQGHIKFYLLADIFPETALQDWYVFVHDIKKQSGKHRHQGGFVLYVIEGRGATEVNGEMVEWEEGDCILLPLSPQGVEHVHFNRGDTPAKWLALIYEPDFDHLASELTQSQVSPEFQSQYGG